MRRAGTGDAVEATEMHDGSPVVHRDKLVSRLMTGLVVVPALIPLFLAFALPVLNRSSERPLPAAALPFVIGVLALLSVALVVTGIAFAVLRTVVTERALHVRYGLWGPTIQLPSIRSVRIVRYQATKYGGWGMRRGIDGSWAYVGPAAGDVVEITYDDEEGTSRKVVVGPADPVALVAAVQRARSGAAARIASGASETPLEAAEDVDAAAEEEAAADEVRERRRRTS